MAFTFTVNELNTDSGASILSWKAKLVAGGWVVKSSGDGNAIFSSSGDVLTTSSEGSAVAVANSVSNTNAWFRIQSPDGIRELLWRRRTTSMGNSTGFVLSYSAAAKFTGSGDGAAAAAIAPTATDQVLISRGLRTGTAGDDWNAGQGNTTDFRWDFAIGDVDEGYSFYALGRVSGGDGHYMCGILYDAVVGPQDGDIDPYVLAVLSGFDVGGGNPFTMLNTASARTCRKGADPSLADSSIAATLPWAWQYDPSAEPGVQTHFLLVPVMFENGDGTAPYVLQPGGTNPFDGNYDLYEPLYWARAALVGSSGGNLSTMGIRTGGIKGQSRLIKGVGSNAGYTLLDTSFSKTRMAQNVGYWILWDGSTTPVA